MKAERERRESILKAESVRRINEANHSKKYIAIKSHESLKKLPTDNQQKLLFHQKFNQLQVLQHRARNFSQIKRSIKAIVKIKNFNYRFFIVL